MTEDAASEELVNFKMQWRIGLEGRVCRCGYRWDFCCSRGAASSLLGQLIRKINGYFTGYFNVLWTEGFRNKPGRLQ